MDRGRLIIGHFFRVFRGKFVVAQRNLYLESRYPSRKNTTELKDSDEKS